MTASQLIEVLQKFEKDHGDLPVIMEDGFVTLEVEGLSITNPNHFTLLPVL